MRGPIRGQKGSPSTLWVVTSWKDTTPRTALGHRQFLLTALTFGPFAASLWEGNLWLGHWALALELFVTVRVLSSHGHDGG